ncbi:hypothetical protein [Streptomyces sp. STR69]|uniref:hypothetical protein n=1 Tax=Streptomyces sp. STR69 TaxID=1796942 RepID=UPI0021C95C5B|nr:hypothetical protein [Streptomyces sp. STR69]
MQRVRVPLRVVVGYYADAVLPVYVKIAALSRRESGCEAGVAYLSGLLGLSRSSVERALTQLMRPAPDDDIAEVTSYRRTHQGGRGHTAVRRVRVASRAEHGAWVPTRAAEGLSPRQLRAYAALSYATATGHHLSLAELGHVLRHRSGKKASEPLDPRSVRRILRALEDLGWISVDRRAGYRGRHLYTVHDEPVQAPLTADLDEGSGADLGGGSLATVEDQEIDSPDDSPPAALDIRRRREQVVARGPVENPAGPPLPSTFRRPYAGPDLSLAPRIWDVLEPVKVLLAGLSPYVVRQAAREIGRQLNAGADSERLRARLEFRFASTETIRDPARWLLGAALKPPERHPSRCGLAGCDRGVMRFTDAPCKACAELAAGHPPHRPPELLGRPT